MSSNSNPEEQAKSPIDEFIEALNEFDFETSFYGDSWDAINDGTHPDFFLAERHDCVARLEKHKREVAAKVDKGTGKVIKDPRIYLIVRYADAGEVGKFKSLLPEVLTLLELAEEKQEHQNHVIEIMERKTPPLNTESTEWVMARKENQEKLGYPTSTLATYRTDAHGGRSLSPMFGVDKDGRRWRRRPNSTETSAIYYYVPSLPKRS